MAGDDPEYLDWIRQQPCAKCGSWPSQAHHVTGAGMARRSSDRETVPLCHACHRARHDHRGPFAEWAGEAIRRWERAQARAWRIRYEAWLEVDV